MDIFKERRKINSIGPKDFKIVQPDAKRIPLSKILKPDF